MRRRIVAAWRVLRGEWVAHAPVKPAMNVWVAPPPPTASTQTVTFTGGWWPKP